MRRVITVIALVVSILLVGCASDVTSKDMEEHIESVAQEVADQVGNIVQAEDEHVLMVKNGYPLSYPDCCYGDVFDSFFGSPTWKYFEADTGEQVVEFTGYCMYQDVEVKARLQFILDIENETFETGAMSFNDVPQTILITTAMIQKAFEDYAEKHGVEIGSGNNLEADLSDVFVPETETAESDLEGAEEYSLEENNSSYNEEMENYTGPITIKDIINTQWAMTPNEEYSFTIVGDENDTEFNDVEVYIIETSNPESIWYHGYVRQHTATEMADLYITVGFGQSDEFSITWQSQEMIDYPKLEAIGEGMAEFEGDYHYYGIVN